MLARYGAHYRGWLPNYRAPEVFAAHLLTIHVPRRFYADQLPGIPTIRVFEALACGIPLVSAPWEDAEHLFTPGKDYLVARDGAEMRTHLAALRSEPGCAPTWPRMAWRRSAPATPARTASTSCSAFCDRLRA